MNEKSNTSLTELFGVNPKQEVLSEITTTETTEKFAEDLEKARSNLIDTLNRTNGAVAEMVELSHMAQHPRFYEVLGALLRTNIEASRELVNMHKEARKIDNKSNAEKKNTVVNNNLVCTSADLLSMLKQIKDKNGEG